MSEAIFAALGVVFAALAVYLTVRLINRRELWVTGVAAIGVWNAVCLAVSFVYGPTIGRVVVTAYTAYCGDIQESYGTYARVGQYLGLTITTTMATAATLWFFQALTRRRPAWHRRAVIFAAWEAAVVAILIWSYEVGFPYKINQLGWAIFGPPDDVYSFRNLALHRIVAWLICTTPVVLVGLFFDEKLAAPESLGRSATRDGSGV